MPRRPHMGASINPFWWNRKRWPISTLTWFSRWRRVLCLCWPLLCGGTILARAGRSPSAEFAGEAKSMFKVLTIEREYGSGANEIAEKISERLGWKLWDQSLTTEIARHLECDKLHVEQREERPDPLHYRLFKAFLRGSFEGSLNTHRLKLADAEGIRAVTEQLVRRGAG